MVKMWGKLAAMGMGLANLTGIPQQYGHNRHWVCDGVNGNLKMLEDRKFMELVSHVKEHTKALPVYKNATLAWAAPADREKCSGTWFDYDNNWYPTDSIVKNVLERLRAEYFSDYKPLCTDPDDKSVVPFGTVDSLDRLERRIVAAFKTVTEGARNEPALRRKICDACKVHEMLGDALVLMEFIEAEPYYNKGPAHVDDSADVKGAAHVKSAADDQGAANDKEACIFWPSNQYGRNKREWCEGVDQDMVSLNESLKGVLTTVNARKGDLDALPEQRRAFMAYATDKKLCSDTHAKDENNLYVVLGDALAVENTQAEYQSWYSNVCGNVGDKDLVSKEDTTRFLDFTLPLYLHLERLEHGMRKTIELTLQVFEACNLPGGSEETSAQQKTADARDEL